jgi:hypothetical protein
MSMAAVRDQMRFACDLNRPVTEHFDCVPMFARPISENRNHRSLDVVAERFIYSVTNCEFGHGANPLMGWGCPPSQV